MLEVRSNISGCMIQQGAHEGLAKPMTVSDFSRLSEFIRVRCGIKMPAVKKVMLEARLQKRLRSLGIATFREYCDYLFSRDGEAAEAFHMIDAVTTNKTEFFREPVHFNYISENILPAHAAGNAATSGKAFTIWSAGCSTGEEPYSLAMVLSEFASRSHRFCFSILASDISTRVLEAARFGIYEEERTAAVPQALKLKYLMRSKDRGKGLVRIVPELRSAVRFQRINLMDEHLLLPDPVDAIFCRNVIIYFERECQERILGRLCMSLKPEGHLFLGHSETVHGFDLPLSRVTSTVYRKA